MSGPGTSPGAPNTTDAEPGPEELPAHLSHHQVLLPSPISARGSSSLWPEALANPLSLTPTSPGPPADSPVPADLFCRGPWFKRPSSLTSVPASSPLPGLCPTMPLLQPGLHAGAHSTLSNAKLVTALLETLEWCPTSLKVKPQSLRRLHTPLVAALPPLVTTAFRTVADSVLFYKWVRHAPDSAEFPPLLSSLQLLSSRRPP